MEGDRTKAGIKLSSFFLLGDILGERNRLFLVSGTECGRQCKTTNLKIQGYPKNHHLEITNQVKTDFNKKEKSTHLTTLTWR